MLHIVPEFGPERFDVHIQRTGLPGEVVAPDLVEELLPGHHPLPVRNEDAQQLKLLQGELQRLPGPGDRVVVHIDDDVAAAEDVLPLRRLTPQRCPHPGRQFQQAKGLVM